ncbi:hypothetical protein CHLRE_16g681100v5 [Chlamydomonas reinhardtii]|uniref:Uncharacterized protein n=1 Tax=Chlamydomonas reinhardtii TaxID=3055 RepID=A0A2K3CV36_CHLRE|nr:uncharacterized protein CHLRE_16g681100v5 [Chlamydomonas reinhardtii]PNW72135.1 hypothetical protein CHLRE_16g681100v5 [Chlamydomonas reinhardtii]
MVVMGGRRARRRIVSITSTACCVSRQAPCGHRHHHSRQDVALYGWGGGGGYAARRGGTRALGLGLGSGSGSGFSLELAQRPGALSMGRGGVTKEMTMTYENGVMMMSADATAGGAATAVDHRSSLRERAGGAAQARAAQAAQAVQAAAAPAPAGPSHPLAAKEAAAAPYAAPAATEAASVTGPSHPSVPGAAPAAATDAAAAPYTAPAPAPAPSPAPAAGPSHPSVPGAAPAAATDAAATPDTAPAATEAASVPDTAPAPALAPAPEPAPAAAAGHSHPLAAMVGVSMPGAAPAAAEAADAAGDAAAEDKVDSDDETVNYLKSPSPPIIADLWALFAEGPLDLNVAADEQNFAKWLKVQQQQAEGLQQHAPRGQEGGAGSEAGALQQHAPRGQEGGAGSEAGAPQQHAPRGQEGGAGSEAGAPQQHAAMGQEGGAGSEAGAPQQHAAMGQEGGAGSEAGAPQQHAAMGQGPGVGNVTAVDVAVQASAGVNAADPRADRPVQGGAEARAACLLCGDDGGKMITCPAGHTVHSECCEEQYIANGSVHLCVEGCPSGHHFPAAQLHIMIENMLAVIINAFKVVHDPVRSSLCLAQAAEVVLNCVLKHGSNEHGRNGKPFLEIVKGLVDAYKEAAAAGTGGAVAVTGGAAAGTGGAAAGTGGAAAVKCELCTLAHTRSTDMCEVCRKPISEEPPVRTDSAASAGTSGKVKAQAQVRGGKSKAHYVSCAENHFYHRECVPKHYTYNGYAFMCKKGCPAGRRFSSHSMGELAKPDMVSICHMVKHLQDPIVAAQCMATLGQVVMHAILDVHNNVVPTHKAVRPFTAMLDRWVAAVKAVTAAQAEHEAAAPAEHEAAAQAEQKAEQEAATPAGGGGAGPSGAFGRMTWERPEHADDKGKGPAWQEVCRP